MSESSASLAMLAFSDENEYLSNLLLWGFARLSPIPPSRRPEERMKQCGVAPQPSALQKVSLAHQPARQVPSQPPVGVERREVPSLRLHHLSPSAQVVPGVLEFTSKRAVWVHHLPPAELRDAHLQEHESGAERVEEIRQERRPHHRGEGRGDGPQRGRRRDLLGHDEILRRGVEGIEQTLFRLVIIPRAEIRGGAKVHQPERVKQLVGLESEGDVVFAVLGDEPLVDLGSPCPRSRSPSIGDRERHLQP